MICWVACAFLLPGCHKERVTRKLARLRNTYTIEGTPSQIVLGRAEPPAEEHLISNSESRLASFGRAHCCGPIHRRHFSVSEHVTPQSTVTAN